MFVQFFSLSTRKNKIPPSDQFFFFKIVIRRHSIKFLVSRLTFTYSVFPFRSSVRSKCHRSFNRREGPFSFPSNSTNPLFTVSSFRLAVVACCCPYRVVEGHSERQSRGQRLGRPISRRRPPSHATGCAPLTPHR